jgi:hypothetical protein
VFLNCGIGATKSFLRRLNRATRHRELYVETGTALLSVIEITLLFELFSFGCFHSTVILNRAFAAKDLWNSLPAAAQRGRSGVLSGKECRSG